MKVLNYKEFRVTDEMLASKTKRFVNFFLDRIFVYVIFFIIGIILSAIGYLIGSESIINFLEELQYINRFMDMLITLLVYILYYFVLESITQRTLGKLITHTKVVLENVEKPGADVIVLRSLARIIPFEPFSFLGNIPRGWHDTMTRTFVVDVKTFEEHKKAHEDFQLIGQTSEI